MCLLSGVRGVWSMAVTAAIEAMQEDELLRWAEMLFTQMDEVVWSLVRFIKIDQKVASSKPLSLKLEAKDDWRHLRRDSSARRVDIA